MSFVLFGRSPAVLAATYFLEVFLSLSTSLRLMYSCRSQLCRHRERAVEVGSSGPWQERGGDVGTRGRGVERRGVHETVSAL